MSDQDDIAGLAAEYVLGTLDHAERQDVERRRRHDRTLDAEIEGWERRLSPMLAEVAEVTPRAGLLAAIEARLGAAEVANRDADRSVVTLSAAYARAQRRADGWRRAAVAAMAVAASLAAVVAYPYTGLDGAAREPTMVAVFNPGDTRPAFLLSVDFETREMTVRPVAAEPVTDGTYQLWIVAEPTGPTPRSLGLLDQGLAPTRTMLPAYDEAVLRRATFGISREPRGGSPTGRPSPGALHGTLIPVAH